jgi:hypothetical protein
VSGELVRAGKRRENGEKEGDAVAKATVLNRRDEVGDGQRKGTTWRAWAERGAERGGRPGAAGALTRGPRLAAGEGVRMGSTAAAADTWVR